MSFAIAHDSISSQEKRTAELDSLLIPKHVAIILQGSSKWAKVTGKSISDAYSKRFMVVNEVMHLQTQLNIPVLSLYLLPQVPKQIKSIEKITAKLDSLSEFLSSLKKSETIHTNKIKVNVLGRWYDLPGRIVDTIKDITSDTKDYDSYFLNLFINYDGQQEIVDAVRIIGMKIRANKIDPELVQKETIKEEIYTSYFMPPELIIRTGTHHRLRSFLLWDCADSTIYFSNKLWPDINQEDIINALIYYQNFIISEQKQDP